MKYIDDILSKEKELSQVEYRDSLINEIDKLENEYIKILKLNFKSQELFSKKVLKNKVKNIRLKLRVLQKELDDKYGYDGSSLNHISYDLIKLDYDTKMNNYELFYKIKIDDNPKNNIKRLYKLINNYYEIIRNKEDDDYKSKNEIKEIINFIYSRINIEKGKIKKTNLCINLIENKSENNKEVVKRERTYIDIYNRNNLYNSDLKEVILSFRHIVKRRIINEELIDFLKVIIDRLDNENDKELYRDLVCSTIDSIKYRKLFLNKKDINEKTILKMCSRSFKEFINNIEIYNKEIKEPHDYKFDLIMELLKREDNYLVIKNLIKEYPQILNVRNNKKSIVIYILMMYINNYTSIINDKKYSYNIDYLKSIYKLFCKNDNIYLSYEDQEEIKNIIDKYIEEIISSDINSKRKNYVVNDMKELYIENIKQSEDYHKKVDKFMFDKDIKEILFLDPNHTNRESEINLTDEHTFMLNDEFTSYSFTESKGVKSLKIHVADVSNIVEEGSALDNYFYNSFLDNKKVKKDILSYLQFKEGDIVSAFTYEIIMDDNRNVKDFKMYRSKIKIDGDILNYKDNEYIYQNIRRLVTDYERNNSSSKDYSGLNKIEFVLNSIMKDQYLKRINSNKLPKIGCKTNFINKINSDELSDLTIIFNKLPKNEYKKLRKIICSTMEEKYFTSDIPYKDNIEMYLTGIPNYITLLNQRMIKSLLNNEIHNPMYYDKIKSYYFKLYDNIKEVLNNNLDYKTEEDFNYKKRRRFKTYMYKNEE